MQSGWLGLLALCLATAAIAADSGTRPHPACFEPLVRPAELDDRPAAVNLDACSMRHADKPVTRLRGQTRYERPHGDFGDLRGSLAYERVSGRDDQVLYRLVDNAGGSGVFSVLVTGRQTDTGNGLVLRDIATRDLGDRCHLGSAWVGNDAHGDIAAAVSLTPAALPRVLVAAGHDMPSVEHGRQRVRHAFGDHLETALRACPTCCVGVASYALARDGSGWGLLDMTLDALAPFDRRGTATLARALRASAEETSEGYHLSTEAVGAIRHAMIAAHPEPTDTARVQFWLRELGYYWLDGVDGIAGPRTEAAIRAWRARGDRPASEAEPTLAAQSANQLTAEGVRYNGSRLHPVDEAARDAGFATFIDRLEQVVQRRESEALIAMTAPDILLGFGGSGGHADLRSWLGHAEIAPTIWGQLEDILALGAVREGRDVYCQPYTGCLPEHVLASLDPFRTVIVTADDASLLAAGEENARVIRALDHDILTLTGDSPATDEGYRAVRDAAGRRGFVSRRAVTSVIGPRMEVIRGDASWRISSLVSGD